MFSLLQAIKCSFAGVQPPKNNEFWTRKNCDAIYDQIIEPAELVFVRPTKANNITEKQGLAINSYECDFVDCTTDNDVDMSSRMIDMQYADNIFDVVFTDNQLMNYVIFCFILRIT